MSVETFASLHGGDYSARFVDGRLFALRVSSDDDPATQDARIVEVLNHALEKHDADLLAELRPAPDRLSEQVTKHVERMMRETTHKVSTSPSLQRAVREAIAGAPRAVGHSTSGNVQLSVVGGRIAALEFSETLREAPGSRLTTEIDEALTAALGAFDTDRDMREFAEVLTPAAVAEDAATVAGDIERGPTRW